MASVKSHVRDRPRHSANFAQGSAKKGGAGGRGTWGAPQQDYKYMDEDMHALDADDPNYDELADAPSASIEWSSMEFREESFQETVLSAGTFKRAIHEAIKSFLISFELADFEAALRELNRPELHHEVVKIALNVSLDASDEARKAVSNLLKHLSQTGLITPEQTVFGFRRLYDRLPDLVLDVPKARVMLNEFGRRAALAGVLDPDMADSFRVSAEAYEDTAALKKAKDAFSDILDEYLSHEDIAETATCLRELNLSHLHRELVKMALLRGLDRSNRDRELISRLLAEDDTLISREDVESGFEVLLDRVDDLHADCPNVLRLLSSFLARAVADEAVSPAFVSRSRTATAPEDQETASRPSPPSNEFYSGDVLRSASALLALPHAGARISGIWGPNSCEELQKAVLALAGEYLDTGDADEALRCEKELCAPMFRHELIKRVFELACDRKQREQQLAIALIHRIAAQNDGASAQVRKGLQRIRQGLEEITKDAPHAPALLDQLEQRLRHDNLL